MKIFNDEISTQLTDLLGQLENEVQIAFFSSEKNCRSCKDTGNFITEFSSLNDKISIDHFDLEKDANYANELGVDKVPAIVILDKDKKDYGIRFYGIPAGYEVHSLIASIKEISGIHGDFPDDIQEKIKAIDKEVHIQIFVTPTCSYCPSAVISGHRLAHLNKNIHADMIEANTFPDISQKYGVRGVPKTIINEDHSFDGSQPITKFLELIEDL